MSKYIVSLQVAANFTATVDAKDEGEAYELAQDLAQILANQHIAHTGEFGSIGLDITQDDIYNPISDDVEETPNA